MTHHKESLWCYLFVAGYVQGCDIFLSITTQDSSSQWFESHYYPWQSSGVSRAFWKWQVRISSFSIFFAHLIAFWSNLSELLKLASFYTPFTNSWKFMGVKRDKDGMSMSFKYLYFCSWARMGLFLTKEIYFPGKKSFVWPPYRKNVLISQFNMGLYFLIVTGSKTSLIDVDLVLLKAF